MIIASFSYFSFLPIRKKSPKKNQAWLVHSTPLHVLPFLAIPGRCVGCVPDPRPEPLWPPSTDVTGKTTLSEACAREAASPRLSNPPPSRSAPRQQTQHTQQHTQQRTQQTQQVLNRVVPALRPRTGPPPMML